LGLGDEAQVGLELVLLLLKHDDQALGDGELVVLGAEERLHPREQVGLGLGRRDRGRLVILVLVELG